MRVGILGTDFIHALEYGSVISPKRGSANAMIEVPPLDPELEHRLGQYRCPGATDPSKRWTRSDLENEPSLRGVVLAAIWGEDPIATKTMADQLADPDVVATPEEMEGKVDAVLVCAKEAAAHYELAMPFISSGTHVFIDKPFTTSVPQAQEMVSEAQKKGGMLFSSSPWKWAPVIRDLRSNFKKLGESRAVCVAAPAARDYAFYLSHSIETLQYVMGDGASQVSCDEVPYGYSMRIDYKNGEVGSINAFRGTSWYRHVIAYGVEGYLEADITNGQRDEGKIQTVVEFFRAIASGTPPVPYSYLEEATRILSAGALSISRAGAKVSLDDL